MNPNTTPVFVTNPAPPEVIATELILPATAFEVELPANPLAVMVRVQLDEPFETVIVSPVANVTPTLLTAKPVTGPVPVRTKFQPGVTPRALTPASVWSTPKIPNTWLLTNELDVVLPNSALQNAFD